MNKNISLQATSILQKYPEWHQRVISALNLPPLEPTYYPEVVEIFDQHGLLAGRLHSQVAYETTRTPDQHSDFNAWFFDGELVVFYIDSEVIINRLELLYDRNISN